MQPRPRGGAAARACERARAETGWRERRRHSLRWLVARLQAWLEAVGARRGLGGRVAAVPLLAGECVCARASSRAWRREQPKLRHHRTTPRALALAQLLLATRPGQHTLGASARACSSPSPRAIAAARGAGGAVRPAAFRSLFLSRAARIPRPFLASPSSCRQRSPHRRQPRGRRSLPSWTGRRRTGRRPSSRRPPPPPPRPHRQLPASSPPAGAARARARQPAQGRRAYPTGPVASERAAAAASHDARRRGRGARRRGRPHLG